MAWGGAIVGFSNAYVIYVVTNSTGTPGWVVAIAWVNSFAFVPLLGLTALILLLFPDGGHPRNAGAGLPGLSASSSW